MLRGLQVNKHIPGHLRRCDVIYLFMKQMRMYEFSTLLINNYCVYIYPDYVANHIGYDIL